MAKSNSSKVQKLSNADTYDRIDPQDIDGALAGDRSVDIKVRFTLNYDVFVSPSTQRPVSRASIRELRDSIEHMDEFIVENAIFCTPIWHKEDVRLMVQDGQHRLHALMQEGMEVPYFIVHLDQTQIHTMQKGAGKWKLADYYASYSSQGLEDYIKVMELSKTYNVPLAQIVGQEVAFQNGLAPNSDKSRDMIKDGDLKIQDLERLEKWCQVVHRVIESRKTHTKDTGSGGQGLLDGLHMIFSHPDLTETDLNRLLSRFSTHLAKPSTTSVKYPSVMRKEALEFLIGLLNKRKRGDRWQVFVTGGGGLELYSPEQM
jgi:hypothetical protein